MSDKISISDLDAGFVRCESCKCSIQLAAAEALSIQKCPSCGTPNFIPYKVLGYWLFRPLGGGGMGRVYRATLDTGSGDFAVKILHGTAPADSHLIENLTREAEAGKALGTHKNIISIVEYGLFENDFFIVSEFVEGERLDNLIASKKRFGEKETWQLATQIIDAEMHIISKGYLFRDLKPENIMIDSKGNLRLYDYGLCMSLEQAASGIVHSDSIEGSPFYLPPERVVGAPEGEYSEIYSLGMVVFHMLAGKTYYSEADIKDLISKHVTSLRISTVETHLKHCRRETIDVIDKMIKRRPNDRYHSFAQLKVDIERILASSDWQPIDGSIEAPSNFEAKHDERKFSKKSTIVLLAIFAILLSIFIVKKFMDAKERKKAYIEVAASLGVPVDVAPPSKSLSELKALVVEEVERSLKDEATKMRLFDENAVRNELAKQLQISGKPRAVLKSLSELEEERKKELADIERKPEELLKKDFDESVAKVEIMRRMGVTESIPKPDCSLGQAIERFQKHIEKLAEEKFSKKELALRQKKEYDENRPFYKGEIVKIMDVAGKEVLGTFDEKSGAKVIIGGREILLKDIPAPQRLRFDESFSEKRATEAMSKVKEKFESDRNKFIEELKKKQQDEFLKKLGFVKNSKGDYSPMEDFLKEELEDARKKHNEDLQKKITNMKKQLSKNLTQDNYYKQNGFCKFRNEWLPEDKALEKAIAEKKELFNNETKKILDAKQKNIEAELTKKIFTSNGYVFYGGEWLPAKELLDRLVKLQMTK